MDAEKYRFKQSYSVNFTVPIEQELKERLQKIRADGVNVASWARDLIREKLPELEKALQK